MKGKKHPPGPLREIKKTFLIKMQWNTQSVYIPCNCFTIKGSLSRIFVKASSPGFSTLVHPIAYQCFINV